MSGSCINGKECKELGDPLIENQPTETDQQEYNKEYFEQEEDDSDVQEDDKKMHEDYNEVQENNKR